MDFQIGQQYSNILHSNMRQAQINSTQQPVQNGHQIQKQSVLMDDSMLQTKPVEIPSARNRNPFIEPMPQQTIQPSVQINIQSLIKPMQPEKPINPPPIVYSFGQPDFANKYFSLSGKPGNRAVPNKKLTWGLGDNGDYKEDDFADILG